MTTIQRRTADRLATGTGVVAKRLGAGLVPEGRPIAAAIRCGGALWLGMRLLDAAHQAPALLVAGTGIWCLSAWKAGGPEAKPAKAAGGAEPTGEQEATKATGPVDEVDEQAEFLLLLHRLMPGATPGRDDRIHLAQIAAAWTGNPADTAPVRALLAELGVPTTALRVPDRGSSTGIYLRDAPPLPDHSRAPLPGVVAGPDQQQQQQQRSAIAAREGFWIKDDPDHPHQSIIEWENAS